MSRAARAIRGRPEPRPWAAVAVAAALAVSACQTAPDAGADAADGLAVAPKAEESAHPGASLRDPSQAALPPEPEIDDDPRRLLGLDGLGVSALLGVPEIIRREPPAEVWQYRSASCVFDVFLYQDAGQQRVTYLEARDDQASRTSSRACLNELLRARPPAPPVS